MDYAQLEIHRRVLLDLYKPLCEAFDEAEDEVDLGLKEMQENIAAEKFMLAFVGEVKSGKSTFINALLEEAILPYDALQATSEIIEIYKSEKKEVRVTFANGGERVAEDDLKTPENELVPFLKNIAAVKEEYRAIPIVQVNRFLTEHYSKKAGRAVFKDGELEHFIANSNLENPHRLDAGEFAGKIREYIKKNIACAEIPQKIALGHPRTPSNLRHFRMVDTPGINAIGGIEEQTKDFLFRADAVIYLHKAGQQESTALRNALDNVLPERVKERLILVLTHRSQSEESAERMLEATCDYYPELGSNNVFFVDSLTELCLRESLYCCKSIDEVKAVRKEDQKIKRITANCFEDADGDRNEFLKLLEEQANFDPIRERIKKDAQNSASIQMQQFAERMKGQYEVLCDRIDAKIKPLKEKYEYPQSFVSKIKEQTDEMEKMELDYNRFITELREKFYASDKNSKCYYKIHQIVKGYISEINQKEFNFNCDHIEDQMKSYMERSRADFSDRMKEFIDSLQIDFKQIVEDRDIEVQGDYSITVPKISLDSIWDKAMRKSLSDKDEQLRVFEDEEGVSFSFWDIFTLGISYLIREAENQEKKMKIEKSVPKKLWNNLKVDFTNHLNQLEKDIQKNINDMINNFYDIYKREFGGELSKRKRYMENLKRNKKNNEELKEDISHLELKKKETLDSIQRCKKVKGDLR